MELINKRTSYTVSNDDTVIKLSGEITVGDAVKINSFNGQLQLLDGTYIGNFNYNENGTNCSFSVNDCPATNRDAAYSLLEATVESIKTQLTVQDYALKFKYDVNTIGNTSGLTLDSNSVIIFNNSSAIYSYLPNFAPDGS